jgi:hypothetical protein
MFLPYNISGQNSKYRKLLKAFSLYADPYDENGDALIEEMGDKVTFRISVPLSNHDALATIERLEKRLSEQYLRIALGVKCSSRRESADAVTIDVTINRERLAVFLQNLAPDKHNSTDKGYDISTVRT